MISRRNIRIKVLQGMYSTQNAIDSANYLDVKKSIFQIYNQALHFTLANFLLAKNICEYCIIDANIKSSKHLPSFEDLNISLKPSQNTYIGLLNDNGTFNQAIEASKLGGRWQDNEVVKAIYLIISATEDYKTYISTNEREKETELKFFKYVLQQISQNEDAQTLFEDLFLAYEDDKLMVDTWIASNLSQVGTINFMALLSADKSEFGYDLASTTLEKSEHTLSLITPKLINWEADRIANIDMLILQMGLTELLYFPTIPTKVTINEYIDIAKLYSTMQSGQFVNGVLDKIHKELISENKIHKQERPSKKND